MTKKILFIFIATLTLTITPKISAQELEAGFVGPGGCASKEECRAYCDEDVNKEECLTFAVEKGMMTQEEVDKARKFLNQTGPGGCRGDECRDYCEDPANTEECIKFAEQNGLIKPGEGARFRKMREIEQRGGPGGCKGDACRQYCEDESHRNECLTFAKEHELLSQEQLDGIETGRKIEQAIKESGGPGGCKNEKECHQYCSDSSRIEECVAFGAQHTGKPADEIRRMLQEFNENGGRHRNGPGDFEENRGDFETRRHEFEKQFRESGEMREQMMREGFRDAPEGRDESESFEGAGSSFIGPGGCNSPESCRAYCMSNPQACVYRPRSTEAGGLPSMPLESFQGMPSQYEGMHEMMTPPPDDFTSQPTSYNYSRSFLANVWAAFMAPFRK